mgnify:CR=1 FL=1
MATNPPTDYFITLQPSANLKLDATLMDGCVSASPIPITESPPASYLPPRILQRNEFGLICDGSVHYLYNSEGFVDWRRLVPQKYLVPNKQRTEEKDVCKLEDKDLLILLAGIRYLAQVRGYSKVKYRVAAASETYVSVVCSITFCPNFETNGEVRVFEAIGDASIHNTESFAKIFLSATAENRAFVRCVRNFLNINIVAQEELPEVNTATESAFLNSPHLILKQLMEEKKYTFEKLKDKLLKSKTENADRWLKLEDIPEAQIISIIEKINRKKEKSTEN